MMKKVLGVTALACSLLLAGCGNSTDKETAAQPTKEEIIKNKIDARQAEKEREAKENAKIKISTVEEVNYAHYDNVMETNSVYYAAIIENKSKKTVDVSGISLAYLDKKGTVIGSGDSSSVWVSPSVLKPGQKAYVLNDEEINAAVEDYDKTEVTFSPEITDERAKKLPIEGVSVDSDEDTIFLNGKVTNTTDVPTDYVTIAAALYNDKGKFVGVTYGQVQDTLNPKNSMAFQTDGYNFADKIEGLVDKYEVFAYTYEYPEGVAGEGGDGEVTE
ncbi:hypothetical protein CCZ20_24440 [Priestia aryabhattai]|uniref:FxLYD domain-containing protein n=1 Tax=Priestia aryabhattai TaxID=412384 RepID=UPI000B512EC8|nr:FxLYD domain-containing protein [Priestia aryabhattai]OVE34803.1 hypothetical protein CCZ20_24440 [Priestia aryabhattai]